MAGAISLTIQNYQKTFEIVKDDCSGSNISWLIQNHHCPITRIASSTYLQALFEMNSTWILNSSYPLEARPEDLSVFVDVG